MTPESTSREYDSTSRHPVRRFTVSRPPPFRLSFHLCFRVVPVCVSLFSVWDSLGPVAFGVVSRAKKALRVVLRGFVVLPLFTQGQHYAVYLFFTTSGGVGSVSLLSYHGASGETHTANSIILFCVIFLR